MSVSSFVYNERKEESMQHEKDQIGQIEQLRQEYLELKANTPYMKRDGVECKAFHAWYEAAYVFFSSIREFQDLKDFKTFADAEKVGNCFALEHIYDSICPSYKVLINRILESNDNSSPVSKGTLSVVGNNIASVSKVASINNTWPFETDDDHRRVFISYSWDNKVHQEWVLKLCQDLRNRGVDAVIDQAMRKGNDLIDFMEKGIANAHRVLIIGTPNYKQKSEEKKGGVKYEQSIIKTSIFQGLDSDRFITILREGDGFDQSFPSIISTRGGYDMRNDDSYLEHLKALVHEIFDCPIVRLNPIGPVPEFAQQDGGK